MAKEIFTRDSKYMTIHRAKGKEFKEVIVNGVPFKRESDKFTFNSIFLNPEILSENIDVTSLLKEEFMRILYVGYSRAVDKLYVHLYGDESLKILIDESLRKFYGNERKDFYDFIIC